MPARKVLVTPVALDGLDFLLPEERSAMGEMSVSDFLRYELPPLIDLLAEDFEGSTLPTGDGDGRLLVHGGTFVTSVGLFAFLDDDDVVVVTRIMFQK